MEHNVRTVLLRDASALSLMPGVVFRVSGSQQVQFIRIWEKEADLIKCEGLGADGTITPFVTSPSDLPRFIPDVILKHQTIMSDAEWEAFAEFVELFSRRHLSREQVMKMYICFQDMAIEREMAELRQRKEAGE